MLDAVKLNDPYPIMQNGKLVMGPAELDFLKGLAPRLAWVGIPVVFFAFIISYLIARRSVAPIKKLSLGAAEIAKGNFDHKIDATAKGEIGVLVDSFNSMAEELHRSQILRKQFFADAAHELKTPITVLRGNLEGMIDGVIPTDKAMLSSLKEEAEFLADMIDGIKYLAMADSGKLVLEKKWVDINEIVSDCVSQLRAASAIRNLNVETSFKNDQIKAFVDRDKLFQVIYNLLINAGKYTPSGGNIKASTEKVFRSGAEHFKISIKDTGVGIGEADLPYVFERFYRADKSRDRKTGGIGLGLSIVKKITELHGGLVGVESEINKGSTFFVVIPTKKEEVC
jgi:two-component system sensor histidine kinase BaeS